MTEQERNDHEDLLDVIKEFMHDYTYDDIEPDKLKKVAELFGIELLEE